MIFYFSDVSVVCLFSFHYSETHLSLCLQIAVVQEFQSSSFPYAQLHPCLENFFLRRVERVEKKIRAALRPFGHELGDDAAKLLSCFKQDNMTTPFDFRVSDALILGSKILGQRLAVHHGD